jgi:hypothetical protein
MKRQARKKVSAVAVTGTVAVPVPVVKNTRPAAVNLSPKNDVV